MFCIRIFVLLAVIVIPALSNFQVKKNEEKSDTTQGLKRVLKQQEQAISKIVFADSSLVLIKIVDSKQEKLSSEDLLNLINILGTIGFGSWITWKISKKERETSERISQNELSLQLRLAALDKRLKIHQEAYNWCQQILANLRKDEIHKIVTDCEKWWNTHCLYLGGNARGSFFKAFKRAEFFNMFSAQIDEEKKEKRKIWDQIYEAIKLLEKETGLPPIAGEKYPEEIEK